jgi:iron complex outermembrane receptor protein
LIFFFLFQVLGIVKSYSQKASLSISGFVSDPKGESIPGAAVYFHETRTGAYSDSLGNFTIVNIKPGTYHLHIDALGYLSLARTLILTQSVADLHIVLEPSELRTGEVVIESESDKKEQQESSQALSIVNRSYLEKYSTGNLVNTLERLPGVNALRTGVGISKPIIRGMSFNRVLVLENGIRQEGQQWGADHGLEIDEQNADRVEVLRGPGAVIHGADAIGGVLMIRQAPLPSNPGEWQSSAFLTARTLNDLYGGSFMAAANIKGIAWRVRAGYREYGDYKVPAKTFNYNRYILPIYDNQLKNTAGREENFSATLGIQRNWGNTQMYFTRFHQVAGFFPGAFGIPRALSLQPDGDTRAVGMPRNVTTHTKFSSHSNILFRKNWLEIDAGFQQNNRREEALPHASGQVSNNNLALQLILDTWSLNTRYHHHFNSGISLISGVSGQYQSNRKGGFEHLLPEYKSATVGAFSLVQLKLHPDWVLNGGIRYDAGNVRIAETKTLLLNRAGVVLDTLLRNRVSNRLFANLSGSAGMAWKASEDWSFKLNLSSDFRFPTVAELASNGVHHGTFRHVQGDSYLDTERGFQLDGMTEWKQRKVRISFTPFFSYFTNYIYLSPSGQFSTLPESGQIYRYQQSPARFWGGESEIEWALTKNWSIHSVFEYVNGLNSYTQIPLPFIPPGNASLELQWDKSFDQKFLRRLFGSLTFHAFANQAQTDRNERPTPGYSLYHVSGGMHFSIGGLEFRLLVQVQNLSNRAYLNHLSRYRQLDIPEPGRNMIFTLSIPLKGDFLEKNRGNTQ